MHYFASPVSSVLSTAAAASSGLAKDASSAVRELDPTKQRHESTTEIDESYCRGIQPSDSLMRKRRGDLFFRFAGSERSGHWLVVIYSNEHRSYDACPSVDLLHWVGSVMVESKPPKTNPYKEHHLSKRSYPEIIDWCRKYATKHKSYSKSYMNCRRFVIRLAEYCGIATHEIDAQIVRVAHVGSQYYTVRDAGAAVTDGGTDVASGRVLTGSAKIVAAPVKGLLALTSKSVSETASHAHRGFDALKRTAGAEAPDEKHTD